MSSWDELQGLRRRLYLPSLGDLAASMLLLIVASGILLGLQYAPGEGAYQSVARLEQVIPAGWFLRRFHHFAAQLLLLGAVAHTASVLLRRRDGRYKPWRWTKALALLPLAVAGCFTGFVLRGSAESFDAATVAAGLAGSVPLVGDVVARAFYRPDAPGCPLLLPYLHHLATVTVGLFYLSSEHIGRLRRKPASLAWAAALVAALALIFGVPAGTSPDAAPEIVRGPWFFVGIQQLLRWLPALLAGVLIPAAALGLLWAIPLARGGVRKGLLVAVAALAVGYGVLTVVGWVG